MSSRANGQESRPAPNPADPESGVCPKCGSRAIRKRFRHPGETVAAGDEFFGTILPETTELTPWGGIRFLRECLVLKCDSCGYQGVADLDAPGSQARVRPEGRRRRRSRSDSFLKAPRPGEFLTLPVPRSSEAGSSRAHLPGSPAIPVSPNQLLLAVQMVLLNLALLLTVTRHGGLLDPWLSMPGQLILAMVGILALPRLILPPLARVPSSLALAASALLLLWVGFALILCSDARAAWAFVGPLTAATVVYTLAASSGMDARALRVFWSCLLFVAAVVAGFAFWQWMQPPTSTPFSWASGGLNLIYQQAEPDSGWTTHGFFVNRNHLAWFANAACLGGLAWAAFDRSIGRTARFLVLYVALFCGACSIFTASRGGFWGLLAGFLFLAALSLTLFISSRGNRRASTRQGALILFWLGAVGVVAAAIWVAPLALARYTGLADDAFRRGLWEATREVIAAHPLTGVGPMGYANEIRRFLPPWQTTDPLFAHNDYLQFAAEFGLLALQGLVIVLALHLFHGLTRSFFRLRWRLFFGLGGRLGTENASLVAALAILLSMGIHSFFDFNLHLPANAWLAAFFLGLTIARMTRRPSPSIRFARLLPCSPRRLVLAVSGVFALILLGWLVLNYPAQEKVETTSKLLAEGNLDGARAAANKALLLYPENPQIQKLAGQILLEQALSLRPSSVRADYAREAAHHFEEAIRIQPEDYWLHALSGLALGEGGLFSAAKDALGRSTLLAPGYVEPLRLLAIVHEQAGEKEMAQSLYERLLSSPSAGFARHRLNILQAQESNKANPTP